MFKQFCNPILDLDKIIKSYAYNSEFIFVPLGKKMDHMVCSRINMSDCLYRDSIKGDLKYSLEVHLLSARKNEFCFPRFLQ